jgi:two-component system sensor histidine kinase AlgZ
MQASCKHVSLILPDFRNLGVILRSFLLAEGLAFLVTLVGSADLFEAIASFTGGGLLREPVLLVVVALLALVSPGLSRLPYRVGVVGIVVLVFVVGAGAHYLYMVWLPVDLPGGVLRTGLLSAGLAFCVLAYFNWRHRALSPALAEARLIALQARIRPHFLFNSLNAVLGLLRDDPARAERVLENLSELYRALLAEVNALVPLSRELDLARAYADIEHIRLGDRLCIDWQIDASALAARVPPMILQPLLENAVYHGIEPASEGGRVMLGASRKGNEVTLMVRNTCATQPNTRPGNRMAQDNIRERLDLHFDAEARMSTYRTDDEYVVQITLPYRSA